MSRFRGGYGKRPYPSPMRDDYLFDRRRSGPPDMYSQYNRGDFYPPPPRNPRHAPPPFGEDYSDLPMSPFLRRMAGDLDNPMVASHPRIPSKEEVLMELGQSVVSSLKGGQKLSTNPLVRENLEALIQVEKMDFQPPFVGPPRGPYSRYDSFYENGFLPPLPSRPVRPGMGFSAPPRFPLPPARANSSDWLKFLRVGKETDKNRIYASDKELAQFFQMVKEKKPFILDTAAVTRLKNTFSFEISQTKISERRNWLVKHHNRVAHYEKMKSGEAKSASAPATSEKAVSRRRVEWKREKKRLRDKRPPQNETDRRITNYLKHLLFRLCGDEDEEHAVLVLRAIATSTKIIKCLMTECKSFLDQKFGTGTDLGTVDKKSSFLLTIHRKHMEETITTLLALNKTVKDVDDAIYEKYEAALTGKNVDASLFGASADYILEPDKSEDEYIVDLKYDFVRFAFDKFYMKVVDTFCTTKDLRKRINFFMNNGFLAGLIWTQAQGKARDVPGAAMKYLTPMDNPCQENSTKIDKKILVKATARENFSVRTNPTDFTAHKNLTPAQEEVFRQCIAFFDPHATVLKYQLVDYTPNNPLPRDHKLFVFNEIMKYVYLQVLECVVENRNLMTKAYTEMEKDA